MIPSGVPKFDEFLGGGIPEGRNILFEIEPGIEQVDIGLQFLMANRNANAIYVSSKSSAGNSRNFIKEMIGERENITLIDGYASLIGAPSMEKYVVEEPHDIRSYEDAVLDALYEMDGNAIVVFDSLSNIMDMCGERDALEGIERINKEIEKNNSVAIYNFTAWPYKENVLYRLKRIFDTIIEIKDRMNYQRMKIKKIAWDGRKDGILDIKMFPGEGMRIYIPKIVVIGPYQSGKSTFIKSISRKFVPVERMGASVGTEYGMVDYAGYRAEIFGIPGHERFLPLMEKMVSNASGVMVVLDVTMEEHLRQGAEMAHKFDNIPVLIVANKKDRLPSLNEYEIRKKFPENVPVVFTSALNGDGVYEAFEKIANIIVEWLNAG
ncbi:MAG: GTP-binding protein [Thermoplasmata archaeon]|nr:GTP-binding protein [Thermoplasmata archaeon]